MRSLLFSLASFAVGQVAALGTACTAPLSPAAGATDPYWLQNIAHLGTSAYNADPATYQVFRNVKNFGAKGDGTYHFLTSFSHTAEYSVPRCAGSTDDTVAINSAISTGNRCGANGNGCQSSTLTPALVYFPPGTYVVSTPIITLYYTALVGDKRTPPTIKAASNFTGIAVIGTRGFSCAKCWSELLNSK
jgi:hypothetical protein